MTCKSCNQPKKIVGQNLCRTCYSRLWRKGLKAVTKRGRPPKYDKAEKGLSRGQVQNDNTAPSLSDIELIFAAEVSRTTKIKPPRISYADIPLLPTA